MPELPEVETVVRGLRRAGLVGRRLGAVQVWWPRLVAPATPEAFAAALRDRTVTAVARRAKYIVVTLDPPACLLIHLRMTGNLALVAADSPRGPHEHLRVNLDDGRALGYRDTRKFGRWRVMDHLDALDRLLGPEPLAPSFTPATLAQRLSGRGRQLKPLLLDQRVVAGLGNIYVDEALWAARLHPLRNSASLGAEDIARLHGAIRDALARGIRAGGTTLGRGQTNFYSVAGRRGRHQDGLNVFRRTGDPCPCCGVTIVRLVVGQRSTHICPRCQPAPLHHASTAAKRRATRVKGSSARASGVTQATDATSSPRRVRPPSRVQAKARTVVRK